MAPSGASCIRVLFLTLAAVQAQPLREVYSFDLGWRTAVATPPSCDLYSAQLVDVLCDKVTYYPNVTSAVACQAAACAKSVPLWQFCDGTSGCGGVSCGVGVASQCRRESGWIGAMRNASYSGPPADAPEAQPAFDDSQWLVVDTPHDAMIGGSYSREEDPNWAFLPERQYWYRKHFSLLGAWQGSAILLEIEGVLWGEGGQGRAAAARFSAPSRGQASSRRPVCGSTASSSRFPSRTGTFR